MALPKFNKNTTNLACENQISIEDLPTEILVLIMERLDRVSLFYCFFVCKRWRSIVFSIAARDKTNTVWYFMYTQYRMEGFYQPNSKGLLPIQKLIESSLNWDYERSISLSSSVPVLNAVQMNVYRENIIVKTSEPSSVQYFDKKTFEIKKTISIDKCDDFIENDHMVARTIKHYNGDGYTLQLFGKRSIDDCQWISQITSTSKIENSAVLELDVRVFKIEENACFVILKSDNTLYSYHWKYTKNPVNWHKFFRSCYYGGLDVIIAMHLGFRKIYLLTSSGALLCYQSDRKGVIAKVYRFSRFKQYRLVQLVHKSSLVLSVADDCPPRITRLRTGPANHPTLYRLEFSKLTCVTEHGVILFLGFSDGIVKIIKPMAFSREYIFLRCIDLSAFKKEPPGPVVSIAVHIDDGKQSIFIATTSCVYRFTPTFVDENNLWDKENMVSLACVPDCNLVSI